MNYTGINLGNVKNNNRSAILKLLNDQGEMSRKDIATALGLTPATVSVICSELIGDEILRELGEVQEDRRAGRRKILLGINYDHFSVLSVTIENAETCVFLTNLRGENPVSRRMPTDAGAEPEEFLRRVADACESLIRTQGIDRASLLGAGVSIPGVVGPGAGRPYVYRIWNRPVRVESVLQERLGLPVIVRNNVRAFAEAELIFGTGKELENMLFIKWGPGVGFAMIIHKQFYEGSRFKTAELGHMILDPNGELCRCGRRGCLETFVSSYAMARHLREKCSAQTMPELHRAVDGDLSRITGDNLPGLFHLREPAMWDILGADAELFAHWACNVISILVPDKVVIYGKLFDQPLLRERFLARCRQFDPGYEDSYITRSTLSGKIDYIGPLALVVNRLFLSDTIG